jgi:hypothetical protein
MDVDSRFAIERPGEGAWNRAVSMFAIRPVFLEGRDLRRNRITWHGTAVIGAALLAVPLTASRVLAEPKPMPETARVYIIWPSDGAVIHGGFWVRMGLTDAGIAPAGVAKPFTGHHHLLIDCDLPPLDEEIPNDRNHLHFGRGQTEARLDLPPGKHTLQLLLGDDQHVPHKPPLYSKKITITVTQ